MSLHVLDDALHQLQISSLIPLLYLKIQLFRSTRWSSRQQAQSNHSLLKIPQTVGSELDVVLPLRKL